MDIAAEQRQRSFGVWLRTGRRPTPGDQPEVKFNPWHDPKDGRFTFSGSGRYYDLGGATAQENRSGQRVIKFGGYVEDPRLPPISTKEEADAWRTVELAKFRHDPDRRGAIEEQYQRYLFELANPPRTQAEAIPNVAHSDAQQGVGEQQARQSRGSGSWSGGGSPAGGGGGFGGGGATASWGEPSPPPAPQRQKPLSSGGFGEGGGDSGGGGASGSWNDSSKPQAKHPQTAQVATVGSRPTGQWRPVSSNGYLYEIDEQNRTRRVSGEITLNPEQGRSRSAQLTAGGPDRRPTDHGGHYIARRFDGPTEAFNHFAQDGNFHKSDYAKLEEEWARAKRDDKNVRVKIVPVYEGSSQRPSVLNVWFWIDGKPNSARFPNEAQGGKNDKR